MEQICLIRHCGPRSNFSQRMDGWLAILRPFEQYFSHIRMIGGWLWKAECSGTRFTIEKILASGEMLDQQARAEHAELPGFLLLTELCRSYSGLVRESFDQGLHCLPFCLYMLAPRLSYWFEQILESAWCEAKMSRFLGQYVIKNTITSLSIWTS